MKQSSPLISVVAPMYNEESVIGHFIEAATAVLSDKFSQYELILVDDGSSDQTVQACLDYITPTSNIRLIKLSRNYGHEMASTAGLEAARGDYIVLMDSDMQHPPELIPDMVHWADEGYDVVSASRMNRSDEPWLKRKLAQLFYKFSSRMTGFKLTGNEGNFRLLKRRVVDELMKMKETNRHLIMMFSYLGFKTKTVPYYCQERKAGKSKYSIFKLISLSIDSVICFSPHPLRLMSCGSLFISVVMMFYAGFIVFQTLFTESDLSNGIASVIFLTAGLFSVLFLFLAVISEYISRILLEVKKRPLYYIQKEISHEAQAVCENISEINA
ncbi:MAG: glycosyltransferase family 2 protein [Legionellaceae bacterium]|nr:glycosyltransferase family 2 protein [Legionellaceae bacterium]